MVGWTTMDVTASKIFVHKHSSLTSSFSWSSYTIKLFIRATRSFNSARSKTGRGPLAIPSFPLLILLILVEGFSTVVLQVSKFEPKFWLWSLIWEIFYSIVLTVWACSSITFCCKSTASIQLLRLDLSSLNFTSRSINNLNITKVNNIPWQRRLWGSYIIQFGHN